MQTSVRFTHAELYVVREPYRCQDLQILIDDYTRQLGRLRAQFYGGELHAKAIGTLRSKVNQLKAMKLERQNIDHLDLSFLRKQAAANARRMDDLRKEAALSMARGA